jgi:hypothetical protein
MFIILRGSCSLIVKVATGSEKEFELNMISFYDG